MSCLREVQLEIPRRCPLSAEMNDASVLRIGVPVVQLVMSLFTTTARVKMTQNKTCSSHMHLDAMV